MAVSPRGLLRLRRWRCGCRRDGLDARVACGEWGGVAVGDAAGGGGEGGGGGGGGGVGDGVDARRERGWCGGSEIGGAAWCPSASSCSSSTCCSSVAYTEAAGGAATDTLPEPVGATLGRARAPEASGRHSFANEVCRSLARPCAEGGRLSGTNRPRLPCTVCKQRWHQ